MLKEKEKEALKNLRKEIAEKEKIFYEGKSLFFWIKERLDCKTPIKYVHEYCSKVDPAVLEAACRRMKVGMRIFLCADFKKNRYDVPEEYRHSFWRIMHSLKNAEK